MPLLSETTDKLSRRERERLRRRQEILRAAQAVFAEKGYTHATLDEIAHRAEFGKGTLYNYFEGGKEAILFACFDELYDDLCALVKTSFAPKHMKDRSFREAFRDFVVAYMNYFLERQELFMILVKEVHRMIFSDEREKAAYFQRQRERMVNALVPTIEQAAARGEIKPLPPHAVAHLIMGNINGLQMHMSLEDGHETPCADATAPVLASSEAAADFLTTMLCDGLLAQPEPYVPTPNP